MRFLFFQKILPWRFRSKTKKKTRKGSTTLFSVFLFFVFSTLGLSMLYLTQIYIKLNSYKKTSTLLDYASENGIKQGFHQLVSILSKAPALSLLSPEETDQLRIDTLNGGKKLIHKLMESDTPLSNSDAWNTLIWKGSTDFLLEKISEKDNYFKTEYKAVISSQGKIRNFKQKKESSLEASIGILAGNIPLPSIPLLIDKKLNPEQEENFSAVHNIELLPGRKISIPPKISFSEGELLPKAATPQLSKALNIEIFHPQNLSTPQLRTALGLEESDEPIPEGVYLIQDDMGLGGIYVQGDLTEMILAIEENFQVISFLNEQGLWVLKFNPVKEETIFLTPTETSTYDRSPKGIIIVNGKIQSMGGGYVDPSGQVHMIKDKEIPSLLQGVNLTIISSDEITLSTHLIQEGVKWIEGVPYVKESKSQLTLFSTGKDFWDLTEREGKIVIDTNAPDEVKIHASLTASGKGFSIEGEKKKVHILGSLQASDYTSNKNALELTFDERLAEENNLLHNAPQTIKPVLCLSSFKTLEWKEF